MSRPRQLGKVRQGTKERNSTEGMVLFYGVLLCMAAMNTADVDAAHADAEAAYQILTGSASGISQLHVPREQ